MNDPLFIGHHGDVGFWKVATLPKNVKEIKGLILHTGEGTHVHAFSSASDVKIYEDVELNRWFVVGGGGATITHEEHKQEIFAPGTIIKTIIERKRNPFTGAIDRVQD